MIWRISSDFGYGASTTINNTRWMTMVAAPSNLRKLCLLAYGKMRERIIFNVSLCKMIFAAHKIFRNCQSIYLLENLDEFYCNLILYIQDSKHFKNIILRWYIFKLSQKIE